MLHFTINIGLDILLADHLSDKSVYNRNYYRLHPAGYECSFYNGFDVILEQCHEDEGYWEYTLGKLEGDRFIEALSFTHYGNDSLILED